MQTRLTRKAIEAWGGKSVFREAERLVKSGGVSRAELRAPWIRGTLQIANRALHSSLKLLPNGTVESHCPCYRNRHQGMICVHVVALALKVLYSRTDPRRRQKYVEEQRRAKRLAAIDPSRYIQRAPPEDASAPAAEIVLEVGNAWLKDFAAGEVPLTCRFQVAGRELRPGQIPVGARLRLPKQDDALLYVLEDICEGPPKDRIPLRRPDFLNILEVWRGRELTTEDGARIAIQAAPVETLLSLELEDASGELTLSMRPGRTSSDDEDRVRYLACPGRVWLCAERSARPAARVLPLPYHAVYDHPVRIPRSNVLRFIRHELPSLAKKIALECDFSPDVFRTRPAEPAFHLTLRGSPAALAAELRVHYAPDQEFPALKAPDSDLVSIPDPEDPFRYLTRNRKREEQAIERIRRCGFEGTSGDRLQPVTGTRQVLNVLGTHVASLRREGWRVSLEGRVAEFMEQTDMATPVVKIEDPPGADIFEVSFSIEDPKGGMLPPAEVQRAILRGEGFLDRNGRTILLDVAAIQAMHAVFEDCAATEGARPGSFRLRNRHAPFVQSSLNALDGIDIEQPRTWHDRCRMQNRRVELEPTPLPGRLETLLRPYQKEGVYWLRFMESAGFGGILADEMGLGKTLQALAWLRLERLAPEARGKPSLIICPTSLVENWQHEAAKFTPELRCLPMNGPQRHEHWDALDGSDLVITSYALIRRDLDRYLAHTFAAVILDEAQHIKNRSTRNAVAVKQIASANRFVLTGTPLENSVADLWSIMDFLMPGYLGAYETFRQTYEIPILREDREGEEAQGKLRRKVHPFLIRRRKREVAEDLPEKIERVSFCTLSDDQQKLYNDLLARGRTRIRSMVAEQGFERSRMEILALLMRLRQVCCHPGLLRKNDSPQTLLAEASSAKLDQFLELLDEAQDSGHRLLVFSQFVGMLTLLRTALETREIPYSYLDGSTGNRMERVHRFNRDPGIPVFLISLKAGGTGLNLTGADMVIHFDPWWNPAVEDQATDRAHRIGQKRTVYSVKLIAEHTIEEKVLEMQTRKRDIIQKTVEREPTDLLRSIGWEDVRKLLEL